MSEDLSILSWNVRGLNDPTHRELVRQTTIGVRPSVVCLQETKLSATTTPIVVDTLGQALTGYRVLDAVGTRGGILLAWDEVAVSMSDFQHGQFAVTAAVTLLLTGATFRLTTCYGPADDRRKEEFLQEIPLKPPAGIPWLILGDFNLI